MVKDLKYIIKRVLIGVGIALILMLFKGGLIADTYALDYTIYFENTTNSNYNTSGSTNTFLYVSGVFNRVSVVSNNNMLQNDGKYELYSTITLGLDRGGLCTSSNFGLRGDFYIGNSRRNQWINPTTTWNNVDDINVGNNSFCNYTWGSVQTFTSNISSNGITYDFYFTNPTAINYIRINRFDLVNIGSTTSDAINNMTNQIINNNNSNTNNIINNQNDNTQNIIDNQNQNTDKEIESQKVCKTDIIDISSISLDNKYLTNQGEVANQNNFGVSDYIQLDSESTLRVTKVNFNNSCFYDSSKTFISCFSPTSLGSINIPSNAKFLRVTFAKNGSSPILELYHCVNGNQAVNDTISDLDKNITDDTGLSNDEIGGYLDLDYASDTPISDLLLMPLTLINKFIDGFNGSCSDYSLGSLLGTSLVLPCINVEDHVGSNVWSIIDGLCSIFLIYNIGLLFVHMYDSITSLNDGFDELYTPKHADVGYTPKHGGGN